MRRMSAWLAVLLALVGLGLGAPAALARNCDLRALSRMTMEKPPVPTGEAKRMVERLRAIHAAKDLAAFEALIGPRSEMSLGGHEGLEGFRAVWIPPHKGGPERLWRVLERIMRFPAGFDAEGTGEILWPWFFAKTPDSVDVFDVVVARPGSRLHGQPRGAVIAELKALTPLVQLPSQEAGAEWLRVAAPGHCGVFVRADDIHALVGARLALGRDAAGQWRLNFFIEGD